MRSGLKFFNKTISNKEERKKSFAKFYEEKMFNSDLPNCPLTLDVPVVPYHAREPRSNRFTYHTFELIALLRHMNQRKINPMNNQPLTLNDIGKELVPDNQTINLVDQFLRDADFTRDDLLEFAGYSKDLYDFLLKLNKNNFDNKNLNNEPVSFFPAYFLLILAYGMFQFGLQSRFFADNCLPDKNGKRYNLISSSFVYKELDIKSDEFTSVQLRYSPLCVHIATLGATEFIYRGLPIEDVPFRWMYTYKQHFATPLLSHYKWPIITYFEMPASRHTFGRENISWGLWNIFLFGFILTEKKWYKDPLINILNIMMSIFSILLTCGFLEDPFVNSIDVNNETALACNTGLGMRFTYNNGTELIRESNPTNKYTQCENGAPSFSNLIYLAVPILTFFAARYTNKQIPDTAKDEDHNKAEVEFENLKRNSYILNK